MNSSQPAKSTLTDIEANIKSQTSPNIHECESPTDEAKEYINNLATNANKQRSGAANIKTVNHQDTSQDTSNQQDGLAVQNEPIAKNDSFEHSCGHATKLLEIHLRSVPQVADAILESDDYSFSHYDKNCIAWLCESARLFQRALGHDNLKDLKRVLQMGLAYPVDIACEAWEILRKKICVKDFETGCGKMFDLKAPDSVLMARYGLYILAKLTRNDVEMYKQSKCKLLNDSVAMKKELSAVTKPRRIIQFIHRHGLVLVLQLLISINVPNTCTNSSTIPPEISCACMVIHFLTDILQIENTQSSITSEILKTAQVNLFLSAPVLSNIMKIIGVLSSFTNSESVNNNVLTAAITAVRIIGHQLPAAVPTYLVMNAHNDPMKFSTEVLKLCFVVLKFILQNDDSHKLIDYFLSSDLQQWIYMLLIRLPYAQLRLMVTSQFHPQYKVLLMQDSKLLPIKVNVYSTYFRAAPTDDNHDELYADKCLIGTIKIISKLIQTLSHGIATNNKLITLVDNIFQRGLFPDIDTVWSQRCELYQLPLCKQQKTRDTAMNLLLTIAKYTSPRRHIQHVMISHHYDGPDLAKICISETYCLYEEGFLIYKKFERGVEAINVLLYDLKYISRGGEFAAYWDKAEVLSILGLLQLDSELVLKAIESFLRADEAQHYQDVILAVNKFAERVQALFVEVIKFLMVWSKVCGKAVDSELIYCYVLVEDLRALEKFISSAHSVILDKVGDLFFSEELFASAKIIFLQISNYAKLASYQEALDAARKANSIQTWNVVCYACVDAHISRFAQMCGVNIIVFMDHLYDLIRHYEIDGHFAELVKHINLFWLRLNIHTLLQACKDNLHRKETVFLYTHYDQFDNAEDSIIQHSPTCWDHKQFKGIIVRVSNMEVLISIISKYIQV